MKVGQLAHGMPIAQSTSSSKTNQTSSGFGQVFTETLQRQMGTQPEQTTVFQSIAVSPISLGTCKSFDDASAVRMMEGFIDALDGYQQRLADPFCSLRDITPSLERLEQAQKDLTPLADEAPADSPLGNIMKEGLITAAMEIQRFHNGAYC